ncbi:penicillin-binding protein 2 [Photobacterium marinum]|uniref:penicillin-binding protein 2 n=1 Tax=Photobacterium marinum TaxID=1056511 RepID=UPI0002E065FF|nr:penicillin-binding protein 2 [Photobacterium marinum]
MSSNKNEFRDFKEEIGVFKCRAFIAFLCMIVLFGVLVANLYNLQVVQYDSYQTLSINNRIKIIPIAPTRGQILDRNGVLLAENRPIYCLSILPEMVGNVDSLLERLKKYIDFKTEQVRSFRERHEYPLNYHHVIILNELTEKQIAHFSVNQYKFPGVSVTVVLKRHYPYGKILTHVLGYVSHINEHDIKQLEKAGKLKNYQATNNIGKLGVERYYEDLLHGTQGYEKVEVNSRGRVIRRINYVPPVDGKDLVLNLDVELQKYAYNKLGNRQGSAVVINPQDNSILAMVSTPSYDPNLFVNGISDTDYRLLLKDPAHPLINRSTLGVYPPASTVKPFMAVAGLQEKVITAQTVRNDHGVWRIPGSKPNSKAWRDWKRWGHGRVDVTRAIEESVDSFFYQVAFDLGIDRISKWMRQFGFGQLSGIDIHEETRANMPTRDWKFTRHHKPWYKGDTVPIGIGQGYWTATPIQIAKATSVLVNHGTVMPPHLLKAVLDPQTCSEKKIKVKKERLPLFDSVSEKNWLISINAMRLVNHGTHGSGRHAFNGTQYVSGGKSGTAQVFGLRKNEKYNSMTLSKQLLDHGLYTAFAPYKHPKFVATVVIEHGNGGARVGAPFIRHVFDYLLLDQGNKRKKNTVFIHCQPTGVVTSG